MNEIKLNKEFSRYNTEIEGVKYIVTVPQIEENLTVQTPEGRVIPKSNEIWKKIYEIVDLI